MNRYLVFDDVGIIYSSTDFDEAMHEFHNTDKFNGDLRFVKQLAIRRSAKSDVYPTKTVPNACLVAIAKLRG